MNSTVDGKFPAWVIRQITLVPRASCLIFLGKSCPVSKIRIWDFRYYDDRIKTFIENYPKTRTKKHKPKVQL